MGNDNRANGSNAYSVDVAQFLGAAWTTQDHCWELVRKFYRVWLEIDLPEIAGDFSQTNEVIRAAESSGNYALWVPEGSPNYGDVVAMTHLKKRAIITHVGVYLGQSQILHTLRGSGVQVTATRNLSFLGLKSLGYWRFNNGYYCGGE